MLAAALWASPARAAERDAKDGHAESCGRGEVSVRDYQRQTYVCKPKLERKRNVFQDEKNPVDPCPEGHWWRKDHRDPCRPVQCRDEQNGDFIPPVCPRHQHEHLVTGQDWTRPIVCVEHYKPGNEKTGGKNPAKGGCDLCTVNERGHFGDSPRPWYHERLPNAREREQVDKQAKASRAAGGGEDAAPAAGGGGFGRFPAMGRGRAPLRPQSRPAPEKQRKQAACGVGQYSVAGETPSCRACPPGAASARAADGVNYCVGGPAERDCPDGQGLVPVSDALEPYRCAPCGPGRLAAAINGWRLCVPGCGKSELPVPERGLMDQSYGCAPPLEALSDERIAALLRPSAPPAADPPAPPAKPAAEPALDPDGKVPLLR